MWLGEKITDKVLLVDLIGRSTIDAPKFDKLVPSLAHIDEYLKEQIIIEAKYYRYIQKQQKQIEKMKKMLKTTIPENFSFKGLAGLSNEVIEKLEKHRPPTLFNASLISGITPAALDNNLVVDMTGLVEMRSYGFPVVFDATHAVQKPGGQGTSTGGNREMVPYLMRAALAVGVDAIFAEVHPDPDHAFSDGPNQIYLSKIREILEEAIAIDDLIKGNKDARKPGNKEIQNSELRTQNSEPRIKLLLTDVDGVLTDAGMYYSENGDEIKKFNTHDGMGLQLIQQKGIKTGIITSEDTKMVERRFKKLKLDYLYQGKREGGKLASALEICKKEGITLANVAYVGDDVNCLELLSNVGLAACPANALETIKQIPGIVHLNKKGGEGCVREFAEMILKQINVVSEQ
jgi:YrbI family 3-deoxy-D-manno-octulosonate 8-phosphate phosphatase